MFFCLSSLESHHKETDNTVIFTYALTYDHLIHCIISREFRHKLGKYKI